MKELPEIDPMQLKPFINSEGEFIVPVVAEKGDPALEGKMMDQREFMKTTHQMTDRELNAMIYNQAKYAVENGAMEDWPKDDFGVLMWFQQTFITPEMRESFPGIAREYLTNEPLVGTEFTDVPYPRMMEKTWEDALNYRLLAMMVLAARKGSVYSRNFLISLYRVYYRHEYNRLKKVRKLTFLDVLEMHDEYCKQNGFVSGHTIDGKMSFREAEIERHRHEAGWTDVTGKNRLDPRVRKHKDGENAERFNDAIKELSTRYASPDEPPLQPTASRLFIICEMLRIPIDPTCNRQATDMNVGLRDALDLQYLDSEEHDKLFTELVERFREYLNTQRPESADPYLYQANKDYVSLEVAEMIYEDVCWMLHRNNRMPYDSHKFDLQDLLAKITLSLEMHFPELEYDFNHMLMLAMVRYLSECIWDLMKIRDQEIDDVLHFQRRLHREEKPEDEPRDERGEKFIRSVENLRKEKKVEPVIETITLDPEGMKAEIEKLKSQLEDREAALVEAEQKIIRQRTLYEKEKERAELLEKMGEETEDEHAELIAIREYVYSLRDEKDIELDEKTQAEITAVLQDKKVAVLGGQERWMKRMRRLFPKWKFISVDDESIGGFTALEGADFIYMYTSCMKHKQYYRAMNLIRKSGKMLFYLGSTNLSENLTRFYRDLHKAQ